MRNFILFFFAITFSAINSVAENKDSSVSTAINELFNQEITKSKLPIAPPLYLKLIKSKTCDKATLVYRCRYVSASSIVDSIESATTPVGTVEISEEQNMVTINDELAQIEELKELILSLDTRGPQVLVEAQIVEVQRGDGEQWDSGFNVSYYDQSTDTTHSIGSVLGSRIGFKNILGVPVPDAGKEGFYPTSNTGWFDLTPINHEYGNGDTLKINAKLSWLANNNKAQILSSPNLLVDLGTTASMSTGTDQPLLNISVNNGVTQESVYYKRTGVNMRVTPLLINDDMVTLQVRPEVTSVIRNEILSQTSRAPVISVRNIDTKLTVKNGGIVAMGGLYSDKDIESEERVPYLSDIPYLGVLFRSKSKEKVEVQLIFLLKTTIVPMDNTKILTSIDKTRKQLKGTADILDKFSGTKEAERELEKSKKEADKTNSEKDKNNE